MKKTIKALGLIGVLSITAIQSGMAFTFRSSETVTAEVLTGGEKSASFQMEVVNTANETPAATGNIGWSNVNPEVTNWKIADQMIKFNWSVTDPNGGIQIYTNNTIPQANPRFVDPTETNSENPDSNPAGLLQVIDGEPTSSITLPLAWSVKISTKIVGTELVTADPNHTGLKGQPEDENAFQWFFMLDKETPAIDRDGDGEIEDPETTLDTAGFDNGDDFVTVAKTNGAHEYQGLSGYTPDTDRISYLYFQANFSVAAAQTRYRTSQLTLEAFVE